MTQESSPEPVQPPANFAKPPLAGWTTLALIFLGMLSLGLLSYFGRSADPDHKFRAYDENIKQAFFQLEVGTELGTSKSVKWEADLKEIANDLEKDSKISPKMLGLLVVVNNELGIKPSALQLAMLRKEDSPKLKKIAELYDPISRVDAQKITTTAKDFEDKELFSNKLVLRQSYRRAGDAKNVPPLFDSWKVRAFPIATLIFGSAICIGPVLWVIYVMMRNSGKFAPKGHPCGSVDRVAGDSYAGRGALLLVALLFSQFIAEILISVARIPDQFSSTLAFVFAIAAAVSIAKLPFNGRVSSLKIVGLRSETPAQDVLWGIGGAIAAVPVYVIMLVFVMMLQKILPEAHHPVQDEFSPATSTLGLILLFLAAAVGAPIFEEITFRGNILPALASVVKSPILAALLCGLSFAMIHPTGIPVWPILAAMGMMASLLTFQRGSLIPAITMHAVHNAAIMLIGVLQI